MSYKVSVKVNGKTYSVPFTSNGKTVLAVGLDAQTAAYDRMGRRPMLIDLTSIVRA